eukprot:4467261-Amphidinium_carterae.1
MRRGAASDGEQRHERQKHSRGKQRKVQQSHKARTESSPSAEGYSSDDDSYYTESDEADTTAGPSGVIAGASDKAARRPYPFAATEAPLRAAEGQQRLAAMASPLTHEAPAAAQPAELAERRVELSMAPSGTGSRLSETDALGAESPYRQAGAHEVPLWVPTRALSCLLRRAPRPGDTNSKCWGCALCVRAIDRRGKKRTPFSWTSSFESLMAHYQAKHADLKAVNQ